MNFFIVLSCLCLLSTSVFAGVLKTQSPALVPGSARKHTHPDLPDEKLLVQRADESETAYWFEKAKDFVAEQVGRELITKPAKNVILFIGDGMSLTTLSSTRMYLGGEEKSLSFEEFPYVGLAKTYCLDQQVADSACTSTSYNSGIKGNVGTVNLDGGVQRGTCDYEPSHRVTSIADWAIKAGKSAGLVTNTRVTHASPSGVYAHSAERDWESDTNLAKRCNPDLVDDIALQLVHGDVGKKLKVIMGGGRREFRGEELEDEELGFGQNKRIGSRNLIAEWLAADSNREYVWNRTALMSVDTKNVGSLMGLFESDHLQYNLENNGDPTLAEMVDKAIDVLSADGNGFFLFVEGGRIDMAHHDNYARLALDETADLAKAVALARAKTSIDDTLIVVSSDHAHTMTYSGYGSRGADIFGTPGRSYTDNLPYMTLSYAQGAGYRNYVNPNGGRINPEDVDSTGLKSQFPALAPLFSETHGGDDVGIFASGPWAHLFSRTMEQNTIPHLMAYALCVGNELTACSS